MADILFYLSMKEKDESEKKKIFKFTKITIKK